jgi:hypothetical protein
LNDATILQKTVSRRVAMTCGHERRIRIQAPEKEMTRAGFDNWVSEAFHERAKHACPTCAAEVEAVHLQQVEDALHQRTSVVFPTFASEPIAVAVYARTLRFSYCQHVETALAVHDPTADNVAYAALAALATSGAADHAHVQLTVQSLMHRFLLERAAQFQYRYWITNKTNLQRNAERDASNPAFFVPALMAAAAGYDTLDAAYAAYRSMFRPVTNADRDLAASGIRAGLPMTDVLDRIVFMHALTPEEATPVPF